MKTSQQVLADLRIASKILSEHYDRCLQQYGDTAKGADWPNETDRRLRYDIMLDLVLQRDDSHARVCDVGCGTGGLLQRIKERILTHIDYYGIDISAAPLAFAQDKYPDYNFLRCDVLSKSVEALTELDVDYFILNGVFTEKQSLTHEEMWDFVQAMISHLWPAARKGIAFNVMSSHVEYEREDLFHLPYDQLFPFAQRLAGRQVVIRADYGLYEYTCYLYKAPTLYARAEADKAETKLTQVPVCHPRLPVTESIIPYIRQIDDARWYSNFGFLNMRFEQRIETVLQQSPSSCVATNSGTSAIAAAIIAVCGRATAARPICLMPSFTFPGSVSAVLIAGYEPHFVDVDADTLMLDPTKLKHHREIRRAGAALVVGAFGAPVMQEEWLRFQDSTGVAVIIDGAACFGALFHQPLETLGAIPVAVSFHATKVMGIGEGGCVISTDAELISMCRRAINFGFLGSRNAMIAGINGKLSEYGAAVGLAAIDEWPRVAKRWLAIARMYQSEFEKQGLDASLLVNLEDPSSYAHFFAINRAQADQVRSGLAALGIDTRRWWEYGCAEQEAYRQYPCDDLPVTQNLAERLVGLPIFEDIDEDTIKRIAQGIKNSMDVN